ncbi:MAG: hypothetical protein KC777_29455 [Cyanobacteria bacterium HKST-UBA02]|nr:hypothetical protein [Cyanobacteria bacterium HKST-UBA02]
METSYTCAMSEQIRTDAPQAVLETVKSLSAAADLIDETLLSLLEKRATLEEKMIRRYLARLAVRICKVKQSLYGKLADPNLTTDGIGESLKELSGLAGEVAEVIGSLLKMIRYDWNFLEQYFEHEFYGRLINEHRLDERLAKAEQKLNQS